MNESNQIIVAAKMTPRDFEALVAAHYRSKGYTVELTPACNDYGVDVFASKDAEKLAVQVKMYGGSARRINREMVMQLHGAKDYFDCTDAVIATNGELAETARAVAAKLRIGLLEIAAEANISNSLTARDRSESSDPLEGITFDHVWEQYVLPLQGRTLVAEDGRENRLVRVDWAGVNRITSNGKPQTMPIEVFRNAINRVLNNGCVTRAEINEEFAQRGSSGVVLLLAQVPLFEHLSNPSRIVRRPSR